MPVVAKAPESTYALAPAGVHKAVCVDIWPQWAEEKREEWGGGLQEKTRVCWLIDEINEENGKPFEVSQIYTLSLHEKANLCRDLESWRGKPFTTEEKRGFDLEKLLGANCQLQIIHAPGSGKNLGKTYANIQSIMPLAKGQEKMVVPKDYVRKQNRTTKDAAPEPREDFGPQDDEEDSSIPF